MQSVRAQNQSERYAIHHETARMGTVAATAHHSGSVTSAISPRIANVSQNIFRCMIPADSENRADLVARAERSLTQGPLRASCAENFDHSKHQAGHGVHHVPLAPIELPRSEEHTSEL